MRLIDEHSAEDYLRGSGHVTATERVCASVLAGGVSNMVLLVELPDRGSSLVLKQARAQLRTAQPWFASVERIWREAEVLAICSRLLASTQKPWPTSPTNACTPVILFEDRENYLFAMAAAPRPNVVWKQQLLASDADPAIATACGRLLGNLHAESWQNDRIREQIGDRTLFDELRVDPYYRTLATAHPDLRRTIAELIESLAVHSCSLVHADFSPKNLLVFAGGLMMVDFETGHFGDPAFDLGFFQSHLVLKACLKIPDHARYLALTRAFHESYCEVLSRRISASELSELWSRGVRHFAACAWARLDAKSPVDYLVDPDRRQRIRLLCREVFDAKPHDWTDVIQRAARLFD